VEDVFLDIPGAFGGREFGAGRPDGPELLPIDNDRRGGLGGDDYRKEDQQTKEGENHCFAG
jgi:hypothetical protein